MKGKMFVAALLVLLFAAFTTDHHVTVFMIGDSTMSNKPLEGGNPERGWGHVLGCFFSEEIRVDNHAMNGRSSKSFIDEGRWDKVLERLKPGDYVFIQFGHNDEKANEQRHTDPGTTFDANLRRFCQETMARGAHPVLFNSIVRRNFGENANAVAEDDVRPEAGKGSKVTEGSKLVDTHGAYLDSPRNVARELGVPFIDANAITHELVEGLGPEESKSLFMWVTPNTCAACPKGREDNTHLNAYGAHVVAGLLVDAVAREVPGLAQYVRHYDITVAKDGSGDFFTVQEAIDAVPNFRKNVRTTILVRKGEYKETVVIPPSKINLSIIGETGAVITNDGYASKKTRFGNEMSTSGSATMYIYAPDFYMYNVTVANTAGRVGQAVACFIEADRSFFRKCRFLGNQDTLYNYGKGMRQYFTDCYVEGTVDFIFGWSTAVFDHCTIHSLGNGYVTAPATDAGQPYGYVFYDCKLTGAEEAQSVYLSRPWRPDAKAVYIRCDLGKHILPAGWHNWNKPEAEQRAFYAEYGSTGGGANTTGRVAWSHQLENLEGYEIREVLKGNDGWNPVDNGNALVSVER